MKNLKKLHTLKITHLALLCAAFFSINHTKAQHKQPFRFTFVASPHVNWLSSDKSSVEPGGSSLGYNFGVDADIYLGSDKYSFGTGLNISQHNSTLTYNKSITIEGESLNPKTAVDYNLKFIEIPTVLRLRTNQFHRMVYYAQFGLFTLINVSATGKTNDPEYSLDGDNVSDVINLFNTGFSVGGGGEYDLGGNNALTFGLIYNNGFTNLTSDFLNENVTIRNIRLRLGIIF